MEESKKKLQSRHFSHEHPLIHTNSPPKVNTTCFGCKLTIFPGKDYYKCKTCPFFLHQVCHNMPQKVQHPADPIHYLTLQTTPSLTKASFNCKACGHHITGFYYNCAKCGDYYHSLCSAVPISVKMPSHNHRMKLEFSPPYDFECDLCKKHSFSGWLYRCGICEFDSHLTCAVTNFGGVWLQQDQSAPRYISSPIDQILDSSNKGLELMELITRGMKASEEIGSDQSQLQDQFSLLSEDPTIPSYQFSDACFSIDFAKSLLGDEYNAETIGEEDQNQKKNIQEVLKVKTSHSYVVLHNDPLKQANQAPTIANKPSSDSHIKVPNPKNGPSVPFSAGIGSHVWTELEQESQKKKPNGTRYNGEGTKSDSEGLGCPCWPRRRS